MGSIGKVRRCQTPAQRIQCTRPDRVEGGIVQGELVLELVTPIT